MSVILFAQELYSMEILGKMMSTVYDILAVATCNTLLNCL